MFKRRVALGFSQPRKGTAYSHVQFITHNHVNVMKSFNNQVFLLASKDYCYFGVENTVLVFSSNILLSLHAYPRFTNLFVFNCDCIHLSGDRGSCATNQKVAGSIPAGVSGFFY